MNGKMWKKIINEGGEGYVPDECIEQDKREHYARQMAALQRSGWDIETTQTRRAEWNMLVKSGAITGADGKADMSKVKAQEIAQGWTMDELRHAVVMHAIG
jgi:hypothetical protein